MPEVGRQVLLDVLSSEGVTHMFGNPGTTELPLMEALSGRNDFHYVLALQEATAVAMADGYALASRRPAVVNLHSTAGLGNGMGNLVNARANGSPIVVTAGQQDRRHLHHDPLLAGDLVGLAQTVTKWSHEVRTLAELPVVLRRAFHDVLSPPTGPVFVGIPSDLLDEEGEVDVPAPSVIDRTTVAGRVDELAALVSDAPPGRLAIVAGDENAMAGGVEPLVRVAELLGAPVWGAPLNGVSVFPTTHPLWRGTLPSSAAGIAAALQGFTMVFYVGGQAFKVYPWSPGRPLPAAVDLVHLSPDPAQLGRTWPTRLGLAADPRTTLEALVKILQVRGDDGAAARLVAEAGQAAQAREEARARAMQDRYSAIPMAPDAAAHALMSAVPEGVPVVNEAVTTGLAVRDLLKDPSADNYFFGRGGGLGWGMPAALGVSLARGRCPVVCVVGDGSAMYSPQALWTAAREDLPVVFVVVNNRQYLILKQALRARQPTSDGPFVGMDVDGPPVDFVSLAASMGVPAQVVDRATDVGDAVRAAMDKGGPQLLELPIAAP